MFVAFFTKDGDRKTQWGQYSKVGDGYSLGFASFLPSSVLLLEVEYRRKRQEAWLDERVRRLVGVLRWIAENGRSDEERERSLEICLKFAPSSIWVSLLSFKSSDFADEQEWRWCYVEPAPNEGRVTLPVKHRTVRSRTVPYVEFALSESADSLPPLRQVVTAPGAEAERRKRAAQESLRKLGYEHTSVRSSRVPLRF